MRKALQVEIVLQDQLFGKMQVHLSEHFTVTCQILKLTNYLITLMVAIMFLSKHCCKSVVYECSFYDTSLCKTIIKCKKKKRKAVTVTICRLEEH